MKLSPAARDGLLQFIKSMPEEFVGMVPALLWVEDRDPKHSGDPGPMLGVYTQDAFRKVTHQDRFSCGEFDIFVVFWPDFYEKHKDWVVDIVNGKIGLVPPDH